MREDGEREDREEGEEELHLIFVLKGVVWFGCWLLGFFVVRRKWKLKSKPVD